MIEDENILGLGAGQSINRTFDPKGNLTQITRRGVNESYTYYLTGDLHTKTNARGKIWTYNNYFRGIPRQEIDPEGAQINRIVNNTGTIASESNGRGFTTSYSYDNMNRITAINKPVGSDVSVSWSSTGRTVTRGLYTQAMTFNGFGKPSNINTAGVTININYDVLGYKSFESYPSAGVGTSFTNDVLGRVTRITEADGSATTITYLAGNNVRTTNARGFSTTRDYRSFGDPDKADEKVLESVIDPTGTTNFSRNLLGQLLSVTKGGITRTYSYLSSNNFLTSKTDPEVGTTTFGRDAVGNMTSRSVGASGTTNYTYDGNNRVTAVNYPSVATPDETINYDNNGNMTGVANSSATRTYTYDANDNLITEKLSIDAKTFTASYAYNGLDYLNTISYPGGKLVAFTPDTLGRPTQVGSYATGVSFHPSGQPKQIVLANGVRTDITLNTRLWVNSIRTSSAAITRVDLGYSYDPLGNVTSINDALNIVNNRTLTYDGVDRLTNASGTGGGIIAYDDADNITSKFGHSYLYSGNRLTSVSGLYSFSYDAHGNVKSNGRHSFTYDDADNLRSVAGPSAASYDYDGNQMRVKSAKDGVVTYNVYAKAGNLLGEYSELNTPLKEYFYLGNKLVAMTANPDSDDDGLPDVWEIKYFHTFAYGPNDDPDGDGFTNMQEFLLGANPAVVTPLPPATVNIAAGNSANTLTWSPVANATSYNLYWSTTPGVTRTNGSKIAGVVNPYNHSGLTNGTRYYYVITAVNSGEESQISSEVNAMPAAFAPPAPANISATAGNGNNTITWSPVNEATNYNLYWSTTPGVNTTTGTKIANVVSPYSHLGLTNGTRYYYVITTVGNGESAASAEVSALAGSGWGTAVLIEENKGVKKTKKTKGSNLKTKGSNLDNYQLTP